MGSRLCMRKRSTFPPLMSVLEVKTPFFGSNHQSNKELCRISEHPLLSLSKEIKMKGPGKLINKEIHLTISTSPFPPFSLQPPVDVSQSQIKIQKSKLKWAVPS